MIEDFETADKIYNLRASLKRLTKAGEITETEAAAWIAGLEESTRDGRFAVELSANTVTGRKA